MESKKSKEEGIHVFADNCLICNHQCYLPSKTEELDRTRIIELRSLFYSVYEIPVPSSFIPTCLDDLPLCTDCTFKLGRLKVLYDQVTLIQKEFVRLKEDIAFNIVDVVAANNGDKFGSLDIWTKPPEVIQSYLKQSEVDTLQHIIFDEWHERYSTDLDDKFDINSFLPSGSKDCSVKAEESSGSVMKWPKSRPQPKKIANRQSQSATSMSSLSTATRSPSSSPKASVAPSTSAITKSLINGAANATTSVKSDKLGRKTTVISITTHENEISKNKSPSSIAKKRKLESAIPEKGDKIAKSIEIMVDDIKKEDEDGLSHEEDDGDMVISMSPGQIRSSEEGYIGDKDGFGYGNESDGDGGLDVQISVLPQKRRIQHNEPDMEYDNMSTSDMGHFLESGDGEEEDPERQEYLSNIIAQLQAGGNNIEFQQNEEGLYVCMFCNKTFIHKYPYRDHLKTHTGEGPRCPICNKIFPKNHNLMLHLRTHTGEKPFKCDVCNKGFADKSNLKVHYRVHTGEKPYKCDYCDQAFVNSSRLVVHRRLHTGERPFSCEFCGKSFSTSNQLAAHIKLHGFDQMDNSAEGYSNLM